MRTWALTWLSLSLVWASGCARETGYAAAGESCVRSVQCQAGLACVGGVCTTDLSGLEGGVVPMPPVDAAMMIDAGMDAATPPDAASPPDSGPPPMPDSGPPPMPDSGPPPDDAG
ncbi:MAG TPA: hypothetical protein VIL20_30000 [Sandaracinaceae bacterium]